MNDIANNAGVSSGAASSFAAGTVRSKAAGALLAGTSVVTPVVGAALAGAIGIVVYGAKNGLGYLNKDRTGKEAVVDVAKNSTGLGISAGIGIWAGGVTAAVSAGVIPVAVGMTAAVISKMVWNGLTGTRP